MRAEEPSRVAGRCNSGWQSAEHLNQQWHGEDIVYPVVTGVNDGDKSLVCADQTIIQAAERNCADVAPLVYKMAKAGAAPVTPEAKYNGMVAAWVGGNIGVISNQISVIYNSGNIDLDAVKILVMQNNFVIDQLVA